jgi:hypothetical protein
MDLLTRASAFFYFNEKRFLSQEKISAKMIAKKDRNWSVEVTTRPIQEKRTEEKMEYESGRPKES